MAQPGGGKGGGNDKNHGPPTHAAAGNGNQAKGQAAGGGRGAAGNKEARKSPEPKARQAAVAQTPRGSADNGKTRQNETRQRASENQYPRMVMPVRPGPEDRGANGGKAGIGTGSGGNAPFLWSAASTRGLVDGCPPGLAKKNNGCTPPGQARNNLWRNSFDRPDWWGYRGWNEGSYRYVDGYLVRYDNSRILSYAPLLGGALAIGSVWPQSYGPVELPGYYSDFYDYGPSYRYADDVIYRIDPETSAIQSIAALLTGNDMVIGQPLPQLYDVYNVPYGYRDRYADGPDALYRYSDGYIYQVDPTTRLIQAAIELLV
jgi:hypothetical protein